MLRGVCGSMVDGWSRMGPSVADSMAHLEQLCQRAV